MARRSSLLVADVGSTMTTVALIDRVAGQYRFVARGEAISTHVAPWYDVLRGVLAAVRSIERLIGRALLDGRGELVRPRQPGGAGVDECVLVASAAPLMRVALVGLTRDISLQRAGLAVAAAPTRPVGCFALDDGPEWRDPNTWLQALRAAQPEVVVIVGGTDGGAVLPVLDLVQLTALHNRLLPPEARPFLCYAGNAQLAPAAAEVFAGIGELRTAANVSPSLAVANLAPLTALLDGLYCDRWLSRVPGWTRLMEWAAATAVSTVRSFGQLIRYVGERYRLNVLGLQLGSTTTVRADCPGKAGNDHESAVAVDGYTLACAELGVGLSAPRVLAQMDIERIVRWLPEDHSTEDALATLLNKGVHPVSVPATSADQRLELALVREIIRAVRPPVEPTAAPGDQWDLIVAAGRPLARLSHPGYVAAAVLDGLEPRGVSKLALDVSGVAGALGAVAACDPLAAVEVVEQDAFVTLGTLVSLSGAFTPRQPALRLTLRTPDGRTSEEVIEGGAVRVIPLPPGRTAWLELYPSPGVDVGVGRPGVSATADVEGGRLGVVVDARGRPLTLPAEAYERQRTLEAWLGALLSAPVSMPVVNPYLQAVAGAA